MRRLKTLQRSIPGPICMAQNIGTSQPQGRRLAKTHASACRMRLKRNAGAREDAEALKLAEAFRATEAARAAEAERQAAIVAKEKALKAEQQAAQQEAQKSA